MIRRCICPACRIGLRSEMVAARVSGARCWIPSSPPPPPSSTWRNLSCVLHRVRHLFGNSCLQLTPGFDEVRAIAVKLEPRQRCGKGAAMNNRALVAWRGISIAQMPLQHQNLPQVLDVPAREREYTETCSQFLGAPMVLIEEANRNQERAEQDSIP